MAEKRKQGVLLIKTDKGLTRQILQSLAQRGINAYTASSNNAAIDLLEKNNIGLVFINLNIAQPDLTLNLLAKIKHIHPQLQTIVTCDCQNEQENSILVPAVVKAIKLGCCEFFSASQGQQKLESLMDIFLPNHKVSVCASAENPERNTFDLYRIIGKSQKLTHIITLAKRVAYSSAPVLITGESGTGKELIAQLVHYSSTRSSGPFVRVNCASLSESLLESELFGHEKGSFTGAFTQRKGRFEMAHGGTILLDEITETPLSFQAKLLRVLEMQSFERVGGNECVTVDARVVSTSNKNLIEEVRNGNFRLDLYYRLSGLRLIVPPLRQRPDDLPELIWHFVNMYAPQAQRKIKDLDGSMMELFSKYSWPGNIRQLRNVVMTSLILGTGDTLSLADVSWILDELETLPQLQPSQTAVEFAQNTESQHSTLAGMPLEEIEKKAIIQTLKQTRGNQLRAAKSLGISDRTLRCKIKRYRQEGELIST